MQFWKEPLWTFGWLPRMLHRIYYGVHRTSGYCANPFTIVPNSWSTLCCRIGIYAYFSGGARLQGLSRSVGMSCPSVLAANSRQPGPETSNLAFLMSGSHTYMRCLSASEADINTCMSTKGGSFQPCQLPANSSRHRSVVQCMRPECSVLGKEVQNPEHGWWEGVLRRK